MKRCYRPEWASNFDSYGGKGVTVYEEWILDRSKFFRWAISNGYKRGLWLDRIAGENSPYCPSNCRFVTPKESARNQSSNRIVTFRGKTKCASEWAEIIGVNRGSLLNRLNRGWSDEEALTVPFDRTVRRKKAATCQT